MARTDLAVVGMRLTAVWLVAQGIIILDQLVIWFAANAGQFEWAWLFHSGQPILLIILAMVFWWCAPRLADRMLPPKAGERVVASTLRSRDLTLSGMMVVGLVFAVLGVISMLEGGVAALARLPIVWEEADGAEALGETKLASFEYPLRIMLGGLVQLVVGLWLAIGGRRIVVTLERLQRGHGPRQAGEADW